MSWTFTFNPVAIPQLLIAVFLLAQGVIVLAQDRRSGLNRSFFLFEFAVFVWLFGMGLSYLSADETTAFLFARIGFLGVVFIPATTYLFSVYYAGDTRQRFLAFAGLVATFIYSLFIGAKTLADGVYLYSWGYYIKLGPVGACALLFFLLFVPLFIRNFYLRYVVAPPDQKRWHFLALITGGFAFLATADFLPSFGFTLPFPPLGFLFVGSLATLMGYFILRYHLIDIKIIAGRTFGHIFLTLTLLLVYGSLFILFSPRDTAPGYLFANAILFIATLYGFTPLKEKSQRIVDELFAKEQINFDKLVGDFTADLRNLRDTQTLLTGLFNFLTEKIRLEGGSVFILESNAKRWAIYRRSYREQGKPEYLDTFAQSVDQQSVVRNLTHIDIRGFANPITVADPLASEGMAVLHAEKGQLAFPLVYRDVFLGFLIVEGRLSKRDFSMREIEALQRMVASFVIAWENARAYEALIAGTKSKNDFATIISHQLRTPLTNIKWVTETLLENTSSFSDENRELIGRISVSTDAMVRLIGQLLSAVGNGKEMPQVSVGLEELILMVAVVAEEYEPMINHKNIRLSKIFPKHLKPIYANKTYLQIILATLLDNAIRYTEKNGTIQISIQEQDEKTALFNVSDTGIGISEAEQPRMFEKFFRANNAIEMTPDGTGLGLFYAKTLVEAQGGTIWFRSTVGNGTTFYFTVPTAA